MKFFFIYRLKFGDFQNFAFDSQTLIIQRI
jgi:hypothetical protein